MIMCVLLCYPVSIRIYYQQGGLFLVLFIFVSFTRVQLEFNSHLTSERRSTEITVDYSSSCWSFFCSGKTDLKYIKISDWNQHCSQKSISLLRECKVDKDIKIYKYNDMFRSPTYCSLF